MYSETNQRYKIQQNTIGTCRQEWNFPNWVSTVLGRSATCWIFFQSCVIYVRRHSANSIPHLTATRAQSGLRHPWKIQRKRPSKSQSITASSRYIICIIVQFGPVMPKRISSLALISSAPQGSPRGSMGPWF